MIMTINRGLWPLSEELVDIQDEFSRFFDSRPAFRAGGSTYPPLNVWQSAEGLIVDAELPGVDPNAVDITVEDGRLTISGQRHTGVESEKSVYYRERPEGNFRRALELPFRVNADKITASYKHGVLRVELPRAEEDKPKRIAIRAD